LWDGNLSATDWYGFGIQANQMRYNVGNNVANHDFLCANSTLLMRVGGNGYINIPALTASKLLLTDGSKTVVSSSYGESDLTIKSANNTFTGGNTFTQTLNISTSKDKFNTTRIPLLTDGGKIYRSEYTESDFVLTSTAQNIAGNKVFLNNPVVQNSSDSSTVAIIAGSSSFNRAQIYFQSFSGSDQSLVMFCDTTTFNFFNYNTSRTIWDIPKSTDRPNFPQSISLSGQSASRILLTDGSKNVVSGSFGESEILRTTTNQAASGEKTFSTGIKLATSGGTPSLLNFYEEWSGTFTFTNIFSVNQTSTVSICRNGSIVSMYVSGIVATAGGASSSLVESTGAVVIPSRFLRNVVFNCGITNCVSNGVSYIGRVWVNGTNGKINITMIGSSWGTVNFNEFSNFSASWTLN
jgi:hypothetical protein